MLAYSLQQDSITLAHLKWDPQKGEPILCLFNCLLPNPNIALPKSPPAAKTEATDCLACVAHNDATLPCSSSVTTRGEPVSWLWAMTCSPSSRLNPCPKSASPPPTLSCGSWSSFRDHPSLSPTTVI